MVSRWRRRTAVEMSSAISAVSLPPASIAVQRVEAQFFSRGLLLVGPFAVPLRSARVEVPAVVVNRVGGPARGCGALFTIGDQRANFGDGFAFEMQKADDHIGNLHAGVVDVVLYIDLLPRGAQQAHKGVAENGIAQMPDVRGLVGIDGSVLDEGVDT